MIINLNKRAKLAMLYEQTIQELLNKYRDIQTPEYASSLESVQKSKKDILDARTEDLPWPMPDHPLWF